MLRKQYTNTEEISMEFLTVYLLTGKQHNLAVGIYISIDLDLTSINKINYISTD